MLWSPAPWRSGYAAACKAVYTGSIPVGASSGTWLCAVVFGSEPLDGRAGVSRACPEIGARSALIASESNLTSRAAGVWWT